MKRSYPILGIPIDILSFEEAIHQIIRWVSSDGPPKQVATINPEFIIEAITNPEFQNTLIEANLRTADGIGVRWAADYVLRRGTASRYLAFIGSFYTLLIHPERLKPFPSVITGADLTTELIRAAAPARLRLFFLGATEEIITTLLKQLERNYPELTLAGESGGEIDVDGSPHDTGIIARINAFAPDLLFVAFGSPKAELFIARYKKNLGATVSLGVGGTFDYLVANKRRAPSALRRRGLEWWWRLLVEPARWRRIFTATLHFTSVVFSSK